MRKFKSFLLFSFCLLSSSLYRQPVIAAWAVPMLMWGLFILDNVLFSLGMALTTYVRKIAPAYRQLGERHQTLSQLARTITGTPWNGFAFFGLGGKPGRKHGSHQ